MAPKKLENEAPTVYNTKSRVKRVSDSELDPDIVDPVDAQEIFDYIRLHISVHSRIFFLPLVKFFVSSIS